MDKRETVLDSIKKLIALGVSDGEIAENLYDVGIEKPEAYALIREARGPIVPITQPVQQKSQAPRNIQNTSAQAQSTSPSDSSEGIFEETVNELSMNDQIVQQLPLDKQASQAQASQAQAKSADDVANRIMSDVASQDGEELQEDEKDLDELEEKVSDNLSNEETNSNEEINEDEETNSDGQINEASPIPILKSTKNSLPQTSQPQASPQPQVQASVQAKQTQAPIKQNPIQNKPSAPQTPAQPRPVAQATSTKPIPAPKQNYFQQNKIPKMDFTAQTSSPKYSPSLEMSPEFEELWKKGIVVAVNAKLAEMKKLKEDVDAQLNEKVDEAVRKELYQFKVLLDSQKELIVSSNKEALEQKQKEIVFIIDAKIAELKQYNKQIGDNLAIIQTAKKQQELALGQINGALDDARRTKSQLLVELNSEMIKSKSQAQSFLDTASMQLKQMDERVNKTLELEKNIADGMLQQAEQKIETLAIQRADELISNMEVEVNRLQSISKKISPETLDQKIQVLEEFRKQFLTNMQENLSQINNAIEQLNQKNALAERELAEKTLAIDAKLEELTKFEKEFTERMEKVVKKK